MATNYVEKTAIKTPLICRFGILKRKVMNVHLIPRAFFALTFENELEYR